jgi:hypothetical protein
MRAAVIEVMVMKRPFFLDTTRRCAVLRRLMGETNMVVSVDEGI